MKNWKRILAAILTLAMLLSMAAISEEQIVPKSAGDQAQVEEPVEDELTEEAAEEAAGEPVGEEATQEPVADESVDADAMPAAPEVVIAPEWEYDAEIGAITIPYVELPEALTFEWSFDGAATQYAVQTAPVPEGDNPEERGERVYTTESRIELPAANYAEGGWFSLYVTAVLEDGTEIEGWKYFRLEQGENERGISVERMQLSADDSDHYDELIRETYEKCKNRYGGSFNGYCSLYVRYQLEELGIQHVPGGDVALGDGNQIYYNLTGDAITSTGFKQVKYPGNNCLYDIIEQHGSKVENIVVSWTHQSKSKGFSDSNPGAGHANFIYVIKNGEVYFSESFNGSSAGEGVPQVLSVSDFMRRYNSDNGDAIGAVLFLKPVSNIVLSAEKSVIPAGKETTLTASISPDDASDKNLEWLSSNPEIASIEKINDTQAVIRGVSSGTATITCSATDGSGVSASCQVTVIDYRTDPAEITLGVGQTATISALQGEKKIKSNFATSDKSIVSLPKKASNQTGITITAKAPGSATITATSKDGKTATCRVTVKPAPSSIEIESDLGKKSMNIGDTMHLSARLSPSDAVSKVTWSMSSSDKKKKIVSLDANSGAVKGLKAGKVTIIAKSHNKKTAKFALQIIDPTMPTDIKLSLDGETKLNEGDTLTLFIDETRELKPIIEPIGTAKTEVKWKPKNSGVAIVKNNVVIPKKGGLTKLTAKTSRGDKEAVIYIQVMDPVKPKQIIGLTKKTMGIGSQWQFEYALEPSNARTRVTYSSSKSTVASVDDNGLVTAKKNGSATITAKTHNGKKLKCKITVKELTGSLQMERESLTMRVNDTYLLSTIALGGSVGSIRFTSSDSTIVSIGEVLSGEAELTAHREGTCVITAESESGLQATCTVTVEPAPPQEETGVQIKGDKAVTMRVGDVLQFEAEVTPADASKELIWDIVKDSTESILIPAIAMDKNGRATALYVGTATIRAKLPDGSSDSVNITVQQSAAGEKQLYKNEMLYLINQINLTRSNVGIYPLGIDDEMMEYAESQLTTQLNSNPEYYKGTNGFIGHTMGTAAGDMEMAQSSNKSIDAMVKSTEYTRMGVAVTTKGYTIYYAVEFA